MALERSRLNEWLHNMQTDRAAWRDLNAEGSA
jgi:hypothetical protein